MGCFTNHLTTVVITYYNDNFRLSRRLLRTVLILAAVSLQREPPRLHRRGGVTNDHYTTLDHNEQRGLTNGFRQPNN